MLNKNFIKIINDLHGISDKEKHYFCSLFDPKVKPILDMKENKEDFTLFIGALSLMIYHQNQKHRLAAQADLEKNIALIMLIGQQFFESPKAPTQSKTTQKSK